LSEQSKVNYSISDAPATNGQCQIQRKKFQTFCDHSNHILK